MQQLMLQLTLYSLYSLRKFSEKNIQMEFVLWESKVEYFEKNSEYWLILIL